MLCARRLARRFFASDLSSVLSSVLLFAASVTPLLAQEWEIEYVACPRQFDNLTDRYIRVDAAGHRHVAFGGFNLHYMWEDGSTWHEDIADPTPHVGSYASLDLDSEGRPHVAYHDEQNGDLRYAWKGPAGWEAEVVDSVGWVGQWTSVAVDGSGVPHIAYYDTTNHDLKYARRMPSGWAIQVVDSTGLVGACASLVLDDSGNGHIAYLERTALAPGSSGMLKSAEWDGVRWVAATIDRSSGGISIGLDTASMPHIAYRLGLCELRHAYWDGEVWHIEWVGGADGQSSIVVDAENTIHVVYHLTVLTGDVEHRVLYARNDGTGWQRWFVWASIDWPAYAYPSLAVTDNGTCHIVTVGAVFSTHELIGASGSPAAWQIQTLATDNSYSGSSLQLTGDSLPVVSFSQYEGSTEQLFYAYRGDSGWHTESVAGERARESSLAVDGAGRPHIAYSYAYSPYGLRYAHSDASGWDLQVVDGHRSAGVSLALDSQGCPSIAFGLFEGSDLWYAHHDSMGWHSGPVNESGTEGRYPSLVVDGSNNAHISYRDPMTADLRCSYQDGTGWSTQTVDSIGIVGEHPSLALDHAGFPHIAYGHWWSSAYTLKYAYRDGTGWHIETVDSTSMVGQYLSCALDSFGGRHISYYDQTDCDLKYAYCDATGWQITTVDAMGEAGGHSSLVVDPIRRAHICYSSDGALKYARMVHAPVWADSSPPLRITAINVWPNPARGVVHARLAGTEGQGMVRLTVIDLLGRRVMSLQQPETMGTEGTITLRLPESIPAGQYFLGVEGEGSRQFVPITVVK